MGDHSRRDQTFHTTTCRETKKMKIPTEEKPGAICGISEMVRNYDLNSHTPLRSFHEFTEAQQREMFAVLVDRITSHRKFIDARFKSDELDELMCYLESIMTRLGYYDDQIPEGEER